MMDNGDCGGYRHQTNPAWLSGSRDEAVQVEFETHKLEREEAVVQR